jgi:hypothetical protein
MACLRAVQEIRFDPKNTANPQVDLLSSGHPAQSASENALTKVEEDLLNLNPRAIVRRKYRKILLTVVQCTVVGACKK